MTRIPIYTLLVLTALVFVLGLKLAQEQEDDAALTPTAGRPVAAQTIDGAFSSIPLKNDQ